MEPILTVPPVVGAPKPNPILVVDDLTKSFGGLKAVDVDHLEVERGVVTALIGPNGAGKSTLFNLLTGFERADTGRWSFDGQPVAAPSPDRLARRGMVRTFQLTKSLSKMSVLDNVLLGAPDQQGERLWAAPFRSRWRGQEESNTGRAEELLERFNLAHMRDELAGTLSGGQRKLLEVA
ncbi:MAG: ATP-binding cassette domain-containing protein, partial [bacterium]|nr:ATP-binding cassette domain-containing protein [bacterium]